MDPVYTRVGFPPPTMAEIDEMAAGMDIARNAVIRMLVRQQLDERKGRPTR